MSLFETIKQSAQLLAYVSAETLWPTRCAICDEVGELICNTCLRKLPYIDQLFCCTTCGAAFRKAICTECNHFILSWKHLDEFPLDGCISAVQLSNDTRRIITCYKDRGEQRLARVIASITADAIPARWISQSVLVPIPTRKEALRQRGFDHLQLIAKSVSELTGIPLWNILAPAPRKRQDQRALNGQERLNNMRHSFHVTKPWLVAMGATSHITPKDSHSIPNSDLKDGTRFILIDDVFTTGATLFAAAEELRHSGALIVSGLTFARA